MKEENKLTYIGKLCLIKELYDDDIPVHIGLSWYVNRNNKSVVKFMPKSNNVFTFSIKDNDKNFELFDKILGMENRGYKIYLACESDNKIAKVKICSLRSEKAIQKLNLVLDEKYMRLDKSDIEFTYDKAIEYQKDNETLTECKSKESDEERIKRLATKERVEGFKKDEKDFLKWYEDEEKVCCYCGISEEYIKLYFNEENPQFINASQRGFYLEIERVQTCSEETNVYIPENTRLACYICNNAKSDFLSAKSFKPIARGINQFWNEYLKEKKNKDVEVKFDETSDIWKKDTVLKK